jgi:hypothetical protein
MLGRIGEKIGKEGKWIVEEEVKIVQSLFVFIVSQLQPILQPLLIAPKLSPSKTILSSLRSNIENFIQRENERKLVGIERGWYLFKWIERWIKQTINSFQSFETTYNSLQSTLFRNGPYSTSLSSFISEMMKFEDIIVSSQKIIQLSDPFSFETRKIKSNIALLINDHLKTIVQSKKESKSSYTYSTSEMIELERKIVDDSRSILKVKEEQQKNELISTISEIISNIALNSSPFNSNQINLPNIHLLHSISKRLNNNFKEYERLSRKFYNLLSRQIQILINKHPDWQIQHLTNENDGEDNLYFLNYYRTQLETSLNEKENNNNSNNNNDNDNANKKQRTPNIKKHDIATTNDEEDDLYLTEISRISSELSHLNSLLVPSLLELSDCVCISTSKQTQISTEDDETNQQEINQQEEEVNQQNEEEDQLQQDDERERVQDEENEALQQERTFIDSISSQSQQEIQLKRMRHQYGLHILKRIKQKLEGRDEELMNDDFPIDEKMGIKEVVKELINQSTSIENLSLLFEGMTAWV